MDRNPVGARITAAVQNGSGSKRNYFKMGTVTIPGVK